MEKLGGLTPLEQVAKLRDQEERDWGPDSDAVLDILEVLARTMTELAYTRGGDPQEVGTRLVNIAESGLILVLWERYKDARGGHYD